MPETESGELPSSALGRYGLHARKRLGQNFLQDRRFLALVADAARLAPVDQVLEIGAGTGALTRLLGARAGRIVAVELDDGLYQMLEQEFAGVDTVELCHANALDIDPCALFSSQYKLVGNIPYYITGPILRRYLEAACQPKMMVLMVQREVADRIVAAPGQLSLLGVSVQYYAQAEIVSRVPAGAFVPRPKVDSAIVRLVPYRQPVSLEERDAFFQMVHAGFATRRKQLVNALRLGLSVPREEAHDVLSDAGIDGSRRAETLSLEEWQRLASGWRSRTDRGNL